MAAKLYFMFWCVDIVVATSICYTKIEGLIVQKKFFRCLSRRIRVTNCSTERYTTKEGSKWIWFSCHCASYFTPYLTKFGHSIVGKKYHSKSHYFSKEFFLVKNMVLLYLLICSSIVYCAWFRPTKTSDKNPTCVSADLAFVAVDQ